MASRASTRSPSGRVVHRPRRNRHENLGVEAASSSSSPCPGTVAGRVVVDYGDGTRVERGTDGGAIIRQLVCGRYCYLMLMPLDPIDTCVRDGTKNRFQLRNGEARHGCAPYSAAPANTGVVHEEADSGMLRVPIRCTVRVRSNLSGVYHRGVDSAEGARRRAATRGPRNHHRGNKREEIALSRHPSPPRGPAARHRAPEKLPNPWNFASHLPKFSLYKQRFFRVSRWE